MIQNEGVIDRMIRGFLSLVVVLLAFFWFSGGITIFLYILAALLLFTAITGFCVLYKILHINTNKHPDKKVSKSAVGIYIILSLVLFVIGAYAIYSLQRNFS